MIKNILTGIDGQTYDMVRVLSVVSIITALGLTIYQVVWQGHEFHIQDFGIGIGAVFASAGAAIKMAQDTEPKNGNTDNS